MNTKRLAELEAARATVSKLEEEIGAERTKELASLPAQYGFETAAAFIKAVKQASGGKKRQGAKGKRRTRAVITDAMKNKVKSLAEGGKTGAEISRTVGISIPSVQNIKKAMGLIKPRKK